MTIELKRPGVSPPEKIIVTDYKSVNSSSGWDILLRCPNSQAHNHNDDHWSCRGNSSERRVKCPVCEFAAVFWDESKAKGNSKSYKPKKNYLSEAEDKKIKSDISAELSTDIDPDNWNAFDGATKERERINIVFRIACLPVAERAIPMGAIIGAGIFKKTDLNERVNIISHLIKKKLESIKEKEKKKKILTKGCPEDLINLIKIDGVVHYLFNKDNKLYSTETIEIDGTTYRAKQDLILNYITESIFDIDHNGVDFADLLKDVERFVRRHVEMPNEHDYFLLALWVFHTYIIDLEHITPFLYFQGEFGTGKSQAGDILKHIAYKAESQTSLTPATMFRSAQYYQTTLVVDGITLVGRDANPDIIDLVKSRYERLSAVPRIDSDDKDRENQIKYYKVFGPLAMGSEQGLLPAIKSRTIHFIMKENIREAVETLIEEDEKSLETAEELRNKLTIFRATLLNKWKRKELKGLKHFARRRLGQILKPLYRVIMEVAPEREEEFLSIVKFLTKKAKKVKQMSLEAEVVKILLDYVKDGKDFIGSLDLCGLLNEDRSESVQINTMKIHYVMESLGFESARIGKKGYLIKKELLKNLKEQYI